ncbi:MAG: S8 family serine peptidase [Actinomycetota bacterium]
METGGRILMEIDVVVRDGQGFRERRFGGRGKRALAISASICLFMCASLIASPARALESQSLPILLVNGAIYPRLHGEGDLPAAFRSEPPGEGVQALYLLQCVQPIQGHWLEEIRARGGTPRGYLAYNTLVVAMDEGALSRIQGLGFVSWCGLYQPYHKLSPALQLRLVQGGEVTALAQVFDQRLLESVLEAFRDLSLEIIAWGGDEWCGLVVLRLPTSLLKDVAALPAVEWLDLCTEGRFLAPTGQGVLGGGEQKKGSGEGNMVPRASPAGTQETVALLDGGLGEASGTGLPAWVTGRIEGPYYLRDGGEGSLEAHGAAMLSALLAGDTALEAEPEVRPLRVLCYATGYGRGVPPSPISMLMALEDAYARGARVFLVGSVPEGRESLARYGIYSFQRDAFAWSRPDALIVEAAGNEGSDAGRDGKVDLGSLLGGSCAKDVISVGGCEGTGSPGGGDPAYRGLDEVFSGTFSASPLAEDVCTGDTRGMAAFSSRGPTDDGRIKPDLVAPATGIPVLAPAGEDGSFGVPGWGGGGARWGCGTSLAAAILAGEAAMLRGSVRQRTGTDPSAALLRALLVNGAEDLHPGQYGVEDPEVPPAPNPVEGWGRPDPSWLEGRRWWIRLVDDREGLRVGDTRVYRVEVSSMSELRVTLAWTDYPALPQSRLRLVNDLDVRVIGPGGESYYPNGRYSRDPLNNTERMVVDVSGKPGIYTVEVKAWNVPLAPQPYALVIQGR